MPNLLLTSCVQTEKIEYILKEILNTEIDYIKDLSIIIDVRHASLIYVDFIICLSRWSSKFLQ